MAWQGLIGGASPEHCQALPTQPSTWRNVLCSLSCMAFHPSQLKVAGCMSMTRRILSGDSSNVVWSNLSSILCPTLKPAGALQVYELDTFKVTHASKYPGPVLSLGIAPDCSLLAVGQADGQLSIRKHARPKVVSVEAGTSCCIACQHWQH